MVGVFGEWLGIFLSLSCWVDRSGSSLKIGLGSGRGGPESIGGEVLGFFMRFLGGTDYGRTSSWWPLETVLLSPSP